MWGIDDLLALNQVWKILERKIILIPKVGGFQNEAGVFALTIKGNGAHIGRTAGC